jgi:hypothetical protein
MLLRAKRLRKMSSPSGYVVSPRENADFVRVDACRGIVNLMVLSLAAGRLIILRTAFFYMLYPGRAGWAFLLGGLLAC